MQFLISVICVRAAVLAGRNCLGGAVVVFRKLCRIARPSRSLCSRQHPHCSENKHSTWRQEFLGRGSENLEQSTRLTAAACH